MAKWDPISSDTPDRIILGAGALYRNYGITASTTPEGPPAAYSATEAYDVGDTVTLASNADQMYWEARVDTLGDPPPASGAVQNTQWTPYTLGTTVVAGEELLGATRGGSTFTIMRDDRMIEVDGTLGPTKGLKRTIEHYATLQTRRVELSQVAWEEITRGNIDTSTLPAHIKIEPTNRILGSDYLDNIALVAEVQGAMEAAAGTAYAGEADAGACIIILENVLVSGEVSFTIDDDDEAVADVTFMSHYLGAAGSGTDALPPYEIRWPRGAI